MPLEVGDRLGWIRPDGKPLAGEVVEISNDGEPVVRVGNITRYISVFIRDGWKLVERPSRLPHDFVCGRHHVPLSVWFEGAGKWRCPKADCPEWYCPETGVKKGRPCSDS